MPINIRELRAKREGSRIETVAPTTAAPTTSDRVKEWRAGQKEYRAAMLARFGGRFTNQAELTAFLEAELANGTRSRAAIAQDAGISGRTLANYIAKGKVRVIRPATEVANGVSGGPFRSLAETHSLE